MMSMDGKVIVKAKKYLSKVDPVMKGLIEKSISFTLEQKIEQVRQQLKEGKAKIVFDMTTNTCNIMPGK